MDIVEDIEEFVIVEIEDLPATELTEAELLEYMMNVWQADG